MFDQTSGTGGNLGVQRNIMRPATRELPEGESLLATPDFVMRLLRVAQVWHYVLIARVLAFFSFAFFPGVEGFLSRPSEWLVMAAGLGCDLMLTVLGQVSRVSPLPPGR